MIEAPSSKITKPVSIHFPVRSRFIFDKSAVLKALRAFCSSISPICKLEFSKLRPSIPNMKLRQMGRQHLHQRVTHRMDPGPPWQRDTRLEGKARRLLKTIGELELADFVEVYWHTRLQTTAGLARFPEMRILLNRRLLEVDEL